MWPDGTAYRCEPFRQESVIDTTGAGDSFHGAFLAMLTKTLCKTADGTNTSTMNETSQSLNAIDLLHSCAHEDLEKAATFASAVAALNTQGIGGRSPLPSLEDIKALIG